MSLSERIQQLNREIGVTVEQAIAELRQEIAQRLHLSNEEIERRIEELTPRLPSAFLSEDHLAPAERDLSSGARRDAFDELRSGIAALDHARSQADVLAALLRESARHASRTALLLVRGSELRGWGSEGFGDAGDAVRELSLNPQEGVWSRLAEGAGAVRLSAGDCADLCSRIESPLPKDGVLVPLVLRDRVAAGLYADRLGDGELELDALQVLAHVAALAIETLPFRERTATATLAVADGNAAAVQPAAVQEAAPAAAPEPAWRAPEPVPEAEPEAAVPVTPAGAPWTAEDEESAVPVEPEEEPASPRYTAEFPLVSLDNTKATEDSAAAVMAAEVPRYPRSVEPEPTAPLELSDLSPEATVLLPRPSLPVAEAPAPPPPLRPVPPLEPAAPAFDRSPALPGTPEVRPPSGVEGPGWAFATTRVPISPSDESTHEEARRLARLLVSEIKLYNEEQVEEGRRNRDIYERLKEDIDRSRQMYDERVDPRILRSTDYFYQELVRILAAGDSRALGI